MPDPRTLALALEVVTAGDPTLPVVLLVHSSGLGALQWRRALSLLSPHSHLVAPNLLGYAGSAPFDARQGPAPAQDLAALEALLPTLPARFDLVGHSYGGTLAARLALLHPARIRSLTLCEPILIGLLAGSPAAAAELAQWNTLPAAPGTPAWLAIFVDYWSGPGAFERMAPALRHQFLALGPKVAAEVDGISGDAISAAAYAALPLPIHVMRGEMSTLAGRTIAEQLSAALPGGHLEVIAGAGHMAPVSHPGQFAALLSRHLGRGV